jgi:hypothetical protein
MKTRFLKLYTTMMLLLLGLQQVAAQGPTSIPTGEPEPVPFTLPNILIFIVAPVLLFIFYIWWLKQKRKEREEELQKKREEDNADSENKTQ